MYRHKTLIYFIYSINLFNIYLILLFNKNLDFIKFLNKRKHT
jgi:hypothetical protein